MEMPDQMAPRRKLFAKLMALWRHAKHRHDELKRFWTPVSITITALSALSTLYKFIQDYARLTLPVIGLILLTLFLLLTVPVRAIRLLGRRSFALLIDGLILAAITFVPLELLQKTVGLDSWVLMLTTWSCFFYFVLFDWVFRGTIGKHFLGLRVFSLENRGFDFNTSFIRTSLQFALPSLGTAIAFTGLFSHRDSLVRSFWQTAIGVAITSAVPISIVVFDGNQGITDAMLDAAVDTKIHKQKAKSLISNRMLVSVISSVLLGLLLTLLSFLLVRGSPFHVLQSWFNETKASNPQIANKADLDPFLKGLMVGLKDPTSSIPTIQIWNRLDGQVNFHAADSAFIIPFDPENELKKNPQIPLLKVFLPQPSVLLKARIMRNLMEMLAPDVTQPNQSQFFMLEFVTTNYFGLYSVVTSESTLLCMRHSGKKVVAFYADGQRQTLGVSASLGDAIWLLFGRLDRIEQSAKTPPF